MARDDDGYPFDDEEDQGSAKGVGPYDTYGPFPWESGEAKGAGPYQTYGPFPWESGQAKGVTQWDGSGSFPEHPGSSKGDGGRGYTKKAPQHYAAEYDDRGTLQPPQVAWSKDKETEASRWGEYAKGIDTGGAKQSMPYPNAIGAVPPTGMGEAKSGPPQQAIQPRPLIPQPFTQADKLHMDRLNASLSTVQQQVADGTLLPQEGNALNQQILQQLQPLQQRQQQTQAQAKQQAIQQTMQDQALNFSIGHQNAVRQAQGFPQAVVPITHPLTGQVALYANNNGKMEPIEFPDPMGGSGSGALAKGEQPESPIDYYPHPLFTQQIQGQPDQPSEPMGPPEEGPPPEQPGAMGGAAQGGLAGPPPEQTYGTPEGPGAPEQTNPLTGKPSSGRVMSIGTPEYGTAAHQRQVQAAGKYQQLVQQGVPQQQAQMMAYQPEKFQRLQMASQMARDGIDQTVTTSVADGLITSSDIRQAQKAAEQAHPLPQRTGDRRIDEAAIMRTRQARIDTLEKILGYTAQNRLARRAEEGRVSSEEQKQANRKELIDKRAEIQKDAAENKAGWEEKLQHLRQGGKITQLEYDHELKLGRLSAADAQKRQAREQKAQDDDRYTAQALKYREMAMKELQAEGNPKPTGDQISERVKGIRNAIEADRPQPKGKLETAPGSAPATGGQPQLPANEGPQEQSSLPPLPHDEVSRLADAVNKDWDESVGNWPGAENSPQGQIRQILAKANNERRALTEQESGQLGTILGKMDPRVAAKYMPSKLAMMEGELLRRKKGK